MDSNRGFHVLRCPYCALPVPVAGPRLVASEYLPQEPCLWHKRDYLSNPKYLLMVDADDSLVIDGQQRVKHYVYLRPGRAA